MSMQLVKQRRQKQAYPCTSLLPRHMLALTNWVSLTEIHGRKQAVGVTIWKFSKRVAFKLLIGTVSNKRDPVTKDNEISKSIHLFRFEKLSCPTNFDIYLSRPAYLFSAAKTTPSYLPKPPFLFHVISLSKMVSQHLFKVYTS